MTRVPCVRRARPSAVLRTLALIAILLLFLGVVYAAHAYLALRLVLDPGLDQPWRGLLLAAIATGGLLLVLEPIGERTLPPRRLRWLSWPAALWMGFAFLLICLVAASDALLWFAGSPALAAGLSDLSSARADASLRAAGVALLALVGCGVALRQGLAPPRLARERWEIERWPRALDGFRIVQLSDVHIGPLLDRRFARHLVERVNALRPDLVVVTGDLVDGSVRHLAPEVAPFRELEARHGVYFVTGNHDHLSGASSWVQAVEDLGMSVLRNRHVEIGDSTGGEAGFDLVGVDDYRGRTIGGGGMDLASALAGRNPERPAVLLAHDPTTFRHARREAIDLQLSGHTHGGQIWPFRYAVRLVVPWVAGRYREGRAQLYVSRGTGFWGPPMRLFAPAEISEHTIHRAPAPL